MAAVVAIAFQDEAARNEFRELADGRGLSLVTVPPVRGGSLAPEIVVALGSAGAFSALFQVIGALVRRNAQREVSITRDGVSVVVKGHSVPEEMELLRLLAPELLEEP